MKNILHRKYVYCEYAEYEYISARLCMHSTWNVIIFQ